MANKYNIIPRLLADLGFLLGFPKYKICTFFFEEQNFRNSIAKEKKEQKKNKKRKQKEKQKTNKKTWPCLWLQKLSVLGFDIKTLTCFSVIQRQSLQEVCQTSHKVPKFQLKG